MDLGGRAASNRGSARRGFRTPLASKTSGPYSPSSSLHREGNLPTIAASHHVHRLAILVQRKIVREDWRQVQVAAPKEAAHLIPRLVHEAAVDAVHRDALRDHFREVEGYGPRVQPEDVDPAGGPYDRKGLREGLLTPGELEDFIDALAGGQVHHFVHEALVRSKDDVGPDRLRQFHPVFVPMADGKDATRSHGPAHGDRHEANRAQAEDRDRLPGDVRVRRRVDGVSEWILHRGELRREVRIVHDDVRGGHLQVFGEGPVTVDPDDRHGLADVRVSRAAHVAGAVGDVTLGAHVVAALQARDAGSHFLDVPGELVTLDERNLDPSLCPGIPIVDVHIGPADRCDLHADQDLRRADRRDWDRSNFRALRRGLRFHRRFHRRRHPEIPRTGPLMDPGYFNFLSFPWFRYESEFLAVVPLSHR